METSALVLKGSQPRSSKKRKFIIDQEITLTNSPLDWYKLTESTKNVLNSVMTFAIKAQLKENLKAKPNIEKLQHINDLCIRVNEINHNSENFQSLEKMKEILDEYTAMFHDIKNKL